MKLQPVFPLRIYGTLHCLPIQGLICACPACVKLAGNLPGFNKAVLHLSKAEMCPCGRFPILQLGRITRWPLIEQTGDLSVRY